MAERAERGAEPCPRAWPRGAQGAASCARSSRGCRGLAAARQRAALRARAGGALRRRAHDRAQRDRPADRGGLGLPDPGPRHLRGRAAGGAGRRAELVHRGHARARAWSRARSVLARARWSRPGGAGAARSSSRRAPPVLRVDRVRTADGEPLAVEQVHLPLGALPGHRGRRLGRRLAVRAARRALRRRAAARPTSACVAVAIEAAEAALLGVPEGAPGPALPDAGARRATARPCTTRSRCIRGDRYEIELRQSAEPGDRASADGGRHGGAARRCCAGWPAAARTSLRLRRRPERRGIVIVARGSSDYAAVFGRYLLEAATGRPVALAAPSLTTLYGVERDLDRLAGASAISQSGRTPEIATVLERYRARGRADGGGDERPRQPARRRRPTRPWTLGAGRRARRPRHEDVHGAAGGVRADRRGARPGRRGATADWERVPDAVRERAGRPRRPPSGPPSGSGDADELVCVGRGYLMPVALEAALKLREAAGVRAEGWSAADFRHGPVTVAGAGASRCWRSSAAGPAAADVGRAGRRAGARAARPSLRLVRRRRRGPALSRAARPSRCARCPPRCARSSWRWRWRCGAGLDPDSAARAVQGHADAVANASRAADERPDHARARRPARRGGRARRGASAPRSGRPSSRAGAVDAACTASASEAPLATRWRTAASSVGTLPASVPSGRRTAPSRTAHRAAAQHVLAGVEHAASTASVTRQKRSPGRQEGAVARSRAPGARRRRWPARCTSGPHQRHAAQAGVARPPAAVGVVHVRDRAGTAVEGGVGVRRVGVGVPARDDDAARRPAVDQLERPGQLGRQRHHRHRPGAEQLLDQRRVGRPQVARGRARPATRATGTGPRGARPARAGRPSARVAPPRPRRRERRGVGASGAEDTNVGWKATTPGARPAPRRRAGSRRGRRRRKSTPGDAVDVGVDEPGHGDARARGRQAHLGHHAVLDRHVALDGLRRRPGPLPLLAATRPPDWYRPAQSRPARPLPRPSHYPARDDRSTLRGGCRLCRRPRPGLVRRKRRARAARREGPGARPQRQARGGAGLHRQQGAAARPSSSASSRSRSAPKAAPGSSS